MLALGGRIGEEEEEDEEMAGRRRRLVAVVDLRVRRSAAMASFGSRKKTGASFSLCFASFLKLEVGRRLLTLQI